MMLMHDSVAVTMRIKHVNVSHAEIHAAAFQSALNIWTIYYRTYRNCPGVYLDPRVRPLGST